MVKKRKEIIKDKCNGKCYYCNAEFTNWDEFGIDHIVPISKGGTNVVENLALACRKCNGLKSNYLIEDWKKIIPILLESAQKQAEHFSKIKARLDQL